MDDYLTTRLENNVQGLTTINANEVSFKNGLHVNDLFVKGNLFHFNLTELIADTVFYTNVETIIDSPKSFIRPVHTEELILSGNLLDVPFNSIKSKTMLPDELVIDKNIRINTISTHKVVVNDAINSIKSHDFGSNWLLVESDQVSYNVIIFNKCINFYVIYKTFTRPQMIKIVESDRGFLTNQPINGFPFDKLYENTLLNREPNKFESVKFGKILNKL